MQIALNHSGKLRSVSVEALRVLSEDTNPTRQTRLQLCSAGAAEAFGLTIENNEQTIKAVEFEHAVGSEKGNSEETLLVAVKDTYDALRGLANILEPHRSYLHKKQDNVRFFYRLH